MTHNITGQEQFVIDILKGKKNGYYVELGAFHFNEGNNTYLLEKEYDWTGVSFEIRDEWKEEFNKNTTERTGGFGSTGINTKNNS